MVQSIKVRYANEQDVKLIKNISWQTFFDTYHPHNTRDNMESFLTSNFNDVAVKRELKNKMNTFVLAYLKKEIVGYAKLSQLNQPVELEDINAMEISRIYVTKEKVGSGVGKVLMNECIEYAKQKSKDVLWLGVWEHNQKAIQFYRRWGFEKFAEQTFLLGNDPQRDWLMKKELNGEIVSGE